MLIKMITKTLTRLACHPSIACWEIVTCPLLASGQDDHQLWTEQRAVSVAQLGAPEQPFVRLGLSLKPLSLTSRLRPWVQGLHLALWARVGALHQQGGVPGHPGAPGAGEFCNFVFVILVALVLNRAVHQQGGVPGHPGAPGAGELCRPFVIVILVALVLNRAVHQQGGVPGHPGVQASIADFLAHRRFVRWAVHHSKQGFMAAQAHLVQ